MRGTQEASLPPSAGSCHGERPGARGCGTLHAHGAAVPSAGAGSPGRGHRAFGSNAAPGSAPHTGCGLQSSAGASRLGQRARRAAAGISWAPAVPRSKEPSQSPTAAAHTPSRDSRAVPWAEPASWHRAGGCWMSPSCPRPVPGAALDGVPCSGGSRRRPHTRVRTHGHAPSGWNRGLQVSQLPASPSARCWRWLRSPPASPGAPDLCPNTPGGTRGRVIKGEPRGCPRAAEPGAGER